MKLFDLLIKNSKMNERILKDILNYVETIERKIPNDIGLGSIESKLDEVIEQMKDLNGNFAHLVQKLDQIYSEMPEKD